MRIKHRFHINGFTLCLTLKQRLGAPRKWPISSIGVLNLSLVIFQVETDDGKYTPMPQGFPKVERDGDMSRFVFRIPKFNKNVLLDPSVTPGAKKVKLGSAASWFQVNFVVAMLLQLVAIFAAQ